MSVPSQSSSPAARQRAVSTRRKRPSRKARSGKSSSNRQSSSGSLAWRVLPVIAEFLGLLGVAMAVVIVLLGDAASRFSGTAFVRNYLAFAAVLTGVAVVGFILLLCWLRVRKWLLVRSVLLPPALVMSVVLLATALVPSEFFHQAFLSYRVLVGGKEEAARIALRHQVYAAYRRFETDSLNKILRQAQPYTAAVEEAGRVYGIDADLLMGMAAAESSFLPRPSADGGQGLFQITRVPDGVTRAVRQTFPLEQQALTDTRYNAHLGAATLRHYLTQMQDDLFLGLLAYNVGPFNGGLRSIMTQYGATDFISIQPYLMKLPRDYPIRVLSYALAFRLQRQVGRILPYEEGGNARRIQEIGVPGLP